jgi:hypothetical protein
MKLQSCRSSENLLAVGLDVVFFFMPYLVAGRKPSSQPFFTPQPSTMLVSNERISKCRNAKLGNWALVVL